MTWLWIAAGILFCLYLWRRAVARGASEPAGRPVLDRRPDRVHLQDVGAHSWRDEIAAERVTEALVENGFQEAGTYKIPELPGVVVRLLASPEDSLYAAIHEHPQAGSWFEVVARYQDRTGITFTTARSAGLPPRPGHRLVHVPGQDAFALCERVATEMPEGALRPATVDRAARDFEEAYAEAAAWRKEHGPAADAAADPARRRAA